MAFNPNWSHQKIDLYHLKRLSHIFSWLAYTLFSIAILVLVVVVLPYYQAIMFASEKKSPQEFESVDLRQLPMKEPEKNVSVWVWRGDNSVIMEPANLKRIVDIPLFKEPANSPYIIPSSKDKSLHVYKMKKPTGANIPYKLVGFYDPKKELQHLKKTDFSQCEYNKCKMIDEKEKADAVIFLEARLNRVTSLPTFKRKPGQRWVFKTDEAPSRFTWFKHMNRTGIKERFNWTLTQKLDSDIPVPYGYLVRKDKVNTNKNYEKIFQSKTKMAAWFVSHCPVRSDRLLYVRRMQNRTKIDIFGACGTLTCGQAEKIPGVVQMRQEADKNECFPLLSASYKFYLAFENSLCQEYVTEKFFKMFNGVDVVPVIRSGANNKAYFPSSVFIDAADFSTPEDLADFLEDLSHDKDRYISYLKSKDKYRSVTDFPEWQCKLCAKLHTDKSKRTYTNVYKWWVKDSCHNPMDSCLLYHMPYYRHLAEVIPKFN